MDVKKWPVLAQILIALGCFGGLRGIIGGLSSQNVLDVIFGIAALAIFWSVYKFKTWALKSLIIFLSLNILFMIISILRGMPPVIGVTVIFLNGFIIYYFNSKEIKELFASV